jgi:transketolase
VIEGARAALVEEFDPRQGILLYADALPPALVPFIDALGSRAVNVGIAEATLISVAAGAASVGLRPVVFGLSPFMMGRAFSQLRQDIAINELPVTLVAFAGGSSLAEMGPSHCTLDELALALLVPGLEISVASDESTAYGLLAERLASPKPGLLRLDGSTMPTGATWDGESIREVRPGEDATIVTYGGTVAVAAAASDALCARGATVRVLDVVRLRPLEPAAVTETIGDAPVLVIDDQSNGAGLGAVVAASVRDHSGQYPLDFLTPLAYNLPCSFEPSDFRVGVDEILARTERLLSAATQGSSRG